MREKLNNIPSYKRKLLLLMLAAVGSVAIGATAAAIVHQMQLENRLKTPTVEAYVEEDLTEKGKKVSFTNQGNANAFVRVSWAESWNLAGKSGATGEVLSNYVQVNNESIPVAVPNWLGVEKKSADPDPSKELWQDGGDGWWYYKKVLPPMKTTERILEKVEFDNVNLISDKALKAKYEKATYDLHFTVEEVQASEDGEVSIDAIKALFGDHVTVKEAEDAEKWKTVWTNKGTDNEEAMIEWDFQDTVSPTEPDPSEETGGEGS